MGQIKVTPCDIEGLYIIEPTVHGDNRGYFMETYNQNDMHEAGLDMVFVQDNQSRSVKGVLRGLHFQKEFPQGKLVRVIKGSVFDVAVDLRAGSKTYGKWFGVELLTLSFTKDVSVKYTMSVDIMKREILTSLSLSVKNLASQNHLSFTLATVRDTICVMLSTLLKSTTNLAGYQKLSLKTA